MSETPSDDALESTLLAGFAADPADPPRLEPALRHFCDAALVLLPVGDVSIWLHDRQAHEIHQSARSAMPQPGEPAASLRSDDLTSPVARALRAPQPMWLDLPDGRAADVPLRGRRRALGVLSFGGVRVEDADRQSFIERIDRLARRLAASIEQVQLLDEVIRSRREIEQTFNALTDLVAVCDRQLTVVQINEAFSAHVKQAAPAIIGRPLRVFLSDETSGWIASAGSDVMHSGEVLHKDVEDLRLGGAFSLTLSRRPGADGQTAGLVVLARNVTEQRRLAVERARLDERLAHTEKLASLGQFVAGIAHELNNPLQGVIGHVDLLRASHKLPAQAVRDLRLITREAERAARIIKDLLVFARAGTPKSRRPVRVSTVLARVLALRSRAMKAAGIDVSRSLPAQLPRVSGEPLLLQQAFLNIVMNAEQAMADGPRRALDVRVSQTEDGARVLVEIRDSGPGIAAEDLPRVFEPFFTTKSVGKGTGLGLALTYGILQDHGGEIFVRNHAEGGAEFTVYLPVLRDPL